MVQRQGRALLGNVSGRSAAGGLLPSDTVNFIQSLGPSYSFHTFQGVDPAELISLIVSNGVIGYSTFHQTADATGTHAGGTDYQVPAGKQLVIGAIIFSAAGLGAHGILGYGDTGVAWGNAVAPTTPVGLGGTDTLVAAAANTVYSLDWIDKVPAAKFPYFYNSSGSVVRIKLVCKLFNA